MNSRSAAWLKRRQSARTTSSLQYEMSMASPQIVFPSRASPRLRGSMIHDRRPLWLRAADRRRLFRFGLSLCLIGSGPFRPPWRAAIPLRHQAMPVRRFLFGGFLSIVGFRAMRDGGARRRLPASKNARRREPSWKKAPRAQKRSSGRERRGPRRDRGGRHGRLHGRRKRPRPVSSWLPERRHPRSRRPCPCRPGWMQWRRGNEARAEREPARNLGIRRPTSW